PSNPDTGRVEYLRHFAEGLYTLHQRIGTNVDVVIINIGLIYSAQRALMSDRRTGISFRILWHDKHTHLAVVRSEERRVGKNVTGVQTCALPISKQPRHGSRRVLATLRGRTLHPPPTHRHQRVRRHNQYRLDL